MISLIWTWAPDDIGGRKMLIVQNERVERDMWLCFTDAVQALSVNSEIESVERLSNEMVHQLTFAEDPTSTVLNQCQIFIDAGFKARCESVEVDPPSLRWTMVDTVKSRLGIATRPPKRHELVHHAASAEVPRLLLENLKSAAMNAKQRVEDGALEPKDAWCYLHLLITGEMITD